MVKKQYRCVWISDVHIGCKASKVIKLLNFLNSFECDKLFLVGDIIDLTKLEKKWYWSKDNDQLLSKIKSMAKSDTEVILLLGNHDYNLKDHKLAEKFGKIDIKKRASYTTSSGEKILIMHGDQIDNSMVRSKFKILNPLAKVINAVVVSKGTLTGRIVEQTYNLLFYKHFIDYSISYAKKLKYNGIVTGHMHHPKIIERSDISFYNTGDWLYSCSALVETLDGKIQVIKHK